jgi:hypothetical protein
LHDGDFLRELAMSIAKFSLPAAVIALALIASPAAYANTSASASSEATAEMIKVADEMSRPENVKKISNLVEGIAGAMMEMPVGQMAAAIEKASPGVLKGSIPANATVADLAGKDADKLPQEFASKTRDMMSMAGSFARIFAEMLPQLERMGEDMEKRVRNR